MPRTRTGSPPPGAGPAPTPPARAREESGGGGRECGPCRETGVIKGPAPHSGTGVVDDQRPRLRRHDARYFGDTGFSRAPEFGIRQRTHQLPARARRADARPRFGDGGRRNRQLDVVLPCLGKAVKYRRQRHCHVNRRRFRKTHRAQPKDGGSGFPQQAGPQHAHVCRENGACGLQADGAVVDGFGTAGEGSQIGEITRIGEPEGLGK